MPLPRVLFRYDELTSTEVVFVIDLFSAIMTTAANHHAVAPIRIAVFFRVQNSLHRVSHRTPPGRRLDLVRLLGADGTNSSLANGDGGGVGGGGNRAGSAGGGGGAAAGGGAEDGEAGGRAAAREGEAEGDAGSKSPSSATAAKSGQKKRGRVRRPVTQVSCVFDSRRLPVVIAGGAK